MHEYISYVLNVLLMYLIHYLIYENTLTRITITCSGSSYFLLLKALGDPINFD